MVVDAAQLPPDAIQIEAVLPELDLAEAKRLGHGVPRGNLETLRVGGEMEKRKLLMLEE